MKNYFSHPNLRKQLEYLNLGIGTILIFISLVYLFNGAIDYFASWFVFGCMYMVMDKYWPVEEPSRSRITADRIKYVVDVFALFVSTGFLLYLLFV